MRPVETIEVRVPEAKDEDYERNGEQVTHRLGQRPGSYVVLRFVRPLLKRKGEAKVPKLLCAPAPTGLWEGSIADVSVVAGVLADKFCHHLPLYRQHQRLAMNGIRRARATLTTWVHRGARLLTPIYEAQLRHILLSKTLAIDETPIKAGRSKPKGKIRTGWYWPVYGEDGEIAFTVVSGYFGALFPHSAEPGTVRGFIAHRGAYCHVRTGHASPYPPHLRALAASRHRAGRQRAPRSRLLRRARSLVLELPVLAKEALQRGLARRAHPAGPLPGLYRTAAHRRLGV